MRSAGRTLLRAAHPGLATRGRWAGSGASRGFSAVAVVRSDRWGTRGPGYGATSLHYFPATREPVITSNVNTI